MMMNSIAIVQAAGHHQQHQLDSKEYSCNDNGNNDATRKEDKEEEEEEEEANTQETFTQQWTQGNELTQLGVDDDDDHDDDQGLSQSRDCHSPLTPIDPLTLPWGRLMPVGVGPAAINDNDGHDDHAAADSTSIASERPSSSSSTSRVPTELLPRLPSWACGTRSDVIATRSRSPSMVLMNGGNHNIGSSAGENKSTTTPLGNTTGNTHHQHLPQYHSPTPRINFLGLKNLLPSDRFNEYVLGRSVKADITAQKLDCPSNTITIGDAAESHGENQKRNEAKRKRHEYVHAMVSNRHCRIYCLLSNVNNNTINNNSNNNYLGSLSSSPSSLSASSPPDMEVFVEDTSGNGTLINGTIQLRKNERRRLHTGDVICLLNPKLLSKKLRSAAERKMYMSQYSYVFVNLYEQEARHGWGIMSGKTKGRKSGGVVNVRAIKCHSFKNHDNSNNHNNHLRSEGNTFVSSMMTGGVDKNQRQLKSSTTDKNNSGARIASYLNDNSRLRPADDTSSSNNQQFHRRRIEEEYDLRDLLGTGTCGEVRRAIHRQTGEERAVKIISLDGRGGGAMPGMSSEKLEAIQAEADILRSLDHPYVVKLFDVFISPGKAIYLVMEFIRGGDLFDRIIERERYTEVQARRLFRRILAAVHYLHEERGIVHRDLKPENILVVDRRSDVNIKLTDFGLAKNMTAEGLKTFCGTPLYFAPEVLRRRHTVKGDGRYGKEIDCWSIGVILFILLSGSPPFDVSSGLDSVASAKIIFHEDQWSHVSREARDLVKRLLEKDPRRRISVRDACRHAWMLIEDGDTHCHPLHDPLIARDESMPAIAEAKVNISEKGHGDDAKPTNIDEKGVTAKVSASPPLTSCQKIRHPVDADGSGVNVEMFREKAAPHNNMSNDERLPSLWSSLKNDKTVTKAIQQACHTSRTSPNGSPIQKRQLFDEPSPAVTNVDSICKRMSKRDMESIMTAGQSLPPPVIAKESLLKRVDAPKRKVQSTLFPPTNDGEEQAKAASLPKKINHVNNQKAGTSTVTPPGTDQNNFGLVFRLNKKQKVGGKYISPEFTPNVTSAELVVKKAELSEDELQSDFSDKEDEDSAVAACGNSSRNLERNPLEKYIHKRKTESIDSYPSVGPGSTMQHSSQECVSRPVSKSMDDDNIIVAKNSPSVEEGKSKSKEKKFIQTCLFGRQPPNNELTIDACNDGTILGIEPSQSTRMYPDDGTVELHGQSVRESIIGNGRGVPSAAPKGKQRSITSWLVK